MITERLFQAASREDAASYIEAVRTAMPSAQAVTQDDWGKSYGEGVYCFNMRFANEADAAAADALVSGTVSIVDPSTIATRDNVWA